VPAVVLIHGGYWQTGDKQSHARLASRVMQWGYAAFAINYRLAPDFAFPAAVEDVQCAVAWVRKQASEYGIAQSYRASWYVRRIVKTFLGCPCQAAAGLCQKASSMTYVTAMAPPTLLVHGTEDDVVGCENSQRLATALEEAGADVTYLPIQEAEHGFVLRIGTPEAETALVAIEAFLAEVFEDAH